MPGVDAFPPQGVPAAQCCLLQKLREALSWVAAVQGSPLVPENMKRVAAGWASSIIVVSDCSRYGAGVALRDSDCVCCWCASADTCPPFW